MKINFTLLLFFSSILFSIEANSQDITSTVQGGEYKFNENGATCLTDVQRRELFHEVRTNISQLKSQKRLAYDETQQRAGHPLFSWPIKMKAGSPYNDVWGISNFVDQNQEYPNKILDYNCGTRSYDTEVGYNHMGVDIFSWPFPWKMMDHDEVEIIAAAPGQIISIGRGHFDRNCEMNNLGANGVIIQHADGSAAVYLHMKKDSPTSKEVGDMVERGEFLGIVGSSGSSTGPHLHFEAYSEIEWKGEGRDVLIDPYAGDCNTMNSDSWWQDQKPYLNTNINAVLTHTATPIYPTCPGQEITNEKNAFATGEMVYFAVYLRDQIAGTNINLKIIRPNGSVYKNWDYNLVQYLSSSYWNWAYNLPDILGDWTWRATYQGQIVEHKFAVGTLGVEDEDFQTTSIYPNPFNDVVNIKSNSLVKKVSVVDILGKTVVSKTNTADRIKEINLGSLKNGLYFLILEGDAYQKKTIKLVKE